MTLNFNLTPQLVLHASLQKLVLLQDFERHYVLCPDFTGKINRAELTAAQWLSNFKVLKRPLESRGVQMEGEG